MDEPYKGLHYRNINSIIKVTKSLIEKGNTVIAIEHNKQYITEADKIIELGPVGGPKGGCLIKTTILKYNKEDEIKKTFANRVFMYSDKKYDNKVFEVNNTIPRKNKKLKITDDTIVSSEFLYDEEELQYGYIEVLERMIGSYQLTKRSNELCYYKCKNDRTNKPLIKDLGLIMKE